MPSIEDAPGQQIFGRCGFFFQFLKYLFIFEKETQSTSRGGAERERETQILKRLQAPSCQHRARRGARTHEPPDGDLSRTQTLNRLSHPGAPSALISHRSGGWASKRKLPADPLSGEDFLARPRWPRLPVLTWQTELWSRLLLIRTLSPPWGPTHWTPHPNHLSPPPHPGGWASDIRIGSGTRVQFTTVATEAPEQAVRVCGKRRGKQDGEKGSYFPGYCFRSGK